jgi:hypothetical protein
MAPARCQGCDAEIDAAARYCPRCGGRRARRRPPILFAIVLGTLLALVAILKVAEQRERDEAQRERDEVARKASAAAPRFSPLTPEQQAAEARATHDTPERVAQMAREAAQEKAGRAARGERALTACMDLMKASLHNADTLVFASQQQPAHEIAADVFRVQVDVSAQDTFSAPRLLSFECVVREQDNGWTLESIRQR